MSSSGEACTQRSTPLVFRQKFGDMHVGKRGPAIPANTQTMSPFPDTDVFEQTLGHTRHGLFASSPGLSIFATERRFHSRFHAGRTWRDRRLVWRRAPSEPDGSVWLR